MDWENEKNCFQAVSAALGNFYAMHPPLLPNPSGDGLKFYEKKKPPKNPGERENSPVDTGMAVCVISVSVLIFKEVLFLYLSVLATGCKYLLCNLVVVCF